MSDTPDVRAPLAALAFRPGLETFLFPESRLAALRPLVRLAAERPLRSFADAREQAALGEVEILVTGWDCPVLDEAALAGLPRLRFVAHAAGTVKDFITPAVWSRGIRVSSAAAANAVPVAEYALAAILLANKGALWADHRYHAGGFAAAFGRADPGNFEKRVGIIGASRVGRLVIDLLRPFDLSVVVYDPYLSAEEAERLGVTTAALPELLKTSDVVSLHMPLLPETAGMIGEAELRLMRDGATLINTARGMVVDAAALERELASGRLHAVLDTTDPEPLPDDSPLRGLENVFLTPHLAGSTCREMLRMSDLAIAEVARWVRGEPLQHEVRAEDWDRIA